MEVNKSKQKRQGENREKELATKMESGMCPSLVECV